MNVDSLMPYVAIAVLMMAIFVGSKVRNLTNTIIPLMEPLTYIMMAVFGAIFIWNVVPVDITTPATISFWIGYFIGYIIIGEVTSEWVAAHDMDRREMDIKEVVYYQNKCDQLCSQPQRFRDVCRHLLFRVDCPLDMNLAAINRRRHVVFHGRFFKLEADVVDMIDYEKAPIQVNKLRFGTYKLNRRGVNRYGDPNIIGKPKYLLHFQCFSEKYTPAPYNTDSPYDFIRKTNIYKDTMKKLAENEMKLLSKDVEKELTLVHGGATMLSDMSKLTLGDLMMSGLKEQIHSDLRIEESEVKNRRAVDREIREAAYENIGRSKIDGGKD